MQLIFPWMPYELHPNRQVLDSTKYAVNQEYKKIILSVAKDAQLHLSRLRDKNIFIDFYAPHFKKNVEPNQYYEMFSELWESVSDHFHFQKQHNKINQRFFANGRGVIVATIQEHDEPPCEYVGSTTISVASAMQLNKLRNDIKKKRVKAVLFDGYEEGTASDIKQLLKIWPGCTAMNAEIIAAEAMGAEPAQMRAYGYTEDDLWKARVWLRNATGAPTRNAAYFALGQKVG